MLAYDLDRMLKDILRPDALALHRTYDTAGRLATVVLPTGTHIDGVADSKVLRAAVREQLAVEIRRRAVGVGIAVVEPDEIDRLNIYQAGLRACRVISK